MCNQFQATKKERRVIHLAKITPLPSLSHKNPRIWYASYTHSTKKRKAIGDEGMATSRSKNNMKGSQNRMCHNVAILSIKIIAQMWYGYPIHEGVAIQRGKPTFKEIWSEEIIFNLGTLLTVIKEFRTLRRTFPRVYHHLYPHERSNAVPSHHLHFTQFPNHEKVK